MTPDPDMSVGDWGGLIGGIVSLLTVCGGGIIWLFGRSDQAKRTREEKLDAWANELDARERKLDEGRTAYTGRLEDRMKVLEAKDEARDLQMTALRIAFELVSSALRHLDPNNTALSLADDLLKTAFPVAPTTPDEMIQSLVAIEKVTGGKI